MPKRSFGALRRARKGMALAMTAVTLPLLGLVMAFAVDLAMATTAQSRLESAVNQAADVAARRLPDEAGAVATARAVASMALADAEGFGRDLVVVVETGPDTMTVRATMRARAFFGTLAGRNGYDLAAQARRSVASP